jgi:hypothetical protein
MIIDLCHGITLAKPPYAFPISLDDLLINCREFPFQPGKEGGTEIETDGGVVIHEIEDLPFTIDDTGIGIGPITFEGDPFVPVMKRVSAFLSLNRFQPWVFSRRLIEVAMNRYKCVSKFGKICHNGALDLLSYTTSSISKQFLDENFSLTHAENGLKFPSDE